MRSSFRARTALAVGVLAAALIATACSSGSGNRADAARPAPSKALATRVATHRSALHDGMRKLWEDHITWTRLYIISAEAGSPDLDTTAQRLLQNQSDIGDAIKPFYGDAAGAKLTALLRDHILTAGDLIAAAKAGDTTKVATTKAAWYTNGNQIADFLAAANPTNWPAAETRPMMRDHLDKTLAEAVDHLQGNWAADVVDYDKVHAQILHMADMLTDGIIAQSPKKF
ncbi:MAG: hypothetical protein JJE46_14150 [Acidimicrobiia bacterium]|nr:hypothetical protein [Acidimicrobiia bacterium]